MDANAISIGDIVLVPLIVGLIQAIKRFAPDAPGNLWFALSIFLGIAGRIVSVLIEYESAGAVLFDGWNLQMWAALIVGGIWFGLASGKAYDATLGEPAQSRRRHAR